MKTHAYFAPVVLLRSLMLSISLVSLLASCGGGSAASASPTGGTEPGPTPTSTPAAVPIWTSWLTPSTALAEPPLPGTSATMFALSQVVRSANQTTLSGKHSLPVNALANYGIAVFLHADVDYLQSDAVAAINADGTFSVTIPRATGTASRAAILLYQKTTDLMASPGCNAAGGYCGGRIDPTTKISLPVSPSLLTAYTVTYFPPQATANDAQIAGLQRLISSFPLSSSTYGAGRLIRSYRDMNSAFLYDQALAIIAFSHAGDRANAELVLNALAALQDSSGAWQFSYIEDGSPAEPDVDRRIAGANAWVAMALNAYQKQFAGLRYLGMSTRLHDYLRSQMTPLTIAGKTQVAIRFAATDYLPGRTRLFALEHQVDAYAAMAQYYKLNGGAAYQTAASQLRAMSESLWNGSRFLAGYDAVSAMFNTTEHYLDNHTWSILALGNVGSRGDRFADSVAAVCDFFATGGAIDYPSRRLTGVTGFYDRYVEGAALAASQKFVWSEGTLGAILAMRQARQGGWSPVSCAGNTEQTISTSVDAMRDSLGGIPYATRNGDADFTSSASVAGIAWLYFVKQAINPFH